MSHRYKSVLPEASESRDSSCAAYCVMCYLTVLCVTLLCYVSPCSLVAESRVFVGSVSLGRIKFVFWHLLFVGTW
jgi:hypothetical protein